MMLRVGNTLLEVLLDVVMHPMIERTVPVVDIQVMNIDQGILYILFGSHFINSSLFNQLINHFIKKKSLGLLLVFFWFY